MKRKQEVERPKREIVPGSTPAHRRDLSKYRKRNADEYLWKTLPSVIWNREGKYTEFERTQAQILGQRIVQEVYGWETGLELFWWPLWTVDHVRKCNERT